MITVRMKQPHDIPTPRTIFDRYLRKYMYKKRGDSLLIVIQHVTAVSLLF